jgi:hypothetical protein
MANDKLGLEQSLKQEWLNWLDGGWPLRSAYIRNLEEAYGAGYYAALRNVADAASTSTNTQSTQCSICDSKSRGCDCKITCAEFIPIGD